MSLHAFDPECPHCRPALIDTKTGKVFPEDHPVSIKVTEIFKASTRQEQEAFFKVTVQNSRDPGDLRLLDGMTQRIQQALKEFSN